MATLYIELPDIDSVLPARWWMCDDSSIAAAGSNPLGEIANLDSGKAQSKLDTVVLIPDREILYVHVDVPGRSQARVRQAAPFAVEPHLTEEIDDVHIALGDFKRGEAVPCMVINRARFDSFLATIDAAGIRANVITTPGMLADSTAGIHLIESGTTITVRTTDQLAVVAANTLATTLSATLTDEQEHVRLTCVGTDAIESVTRQSVTHLNAEDMEIRLISFESLLLGVNEPLDLPNLQQGSYAIVDSDATIKQVLNKTALAAAASVIIVSAIFLVQGFWADVQTERLREDALDIYESVYDTRDVAGNPVFRMQERMGARIDQQSAWLSLLEGVVGATSGVEIKNLDFNEVQSKMSITFYADSYQEFEAIRTRIEEMGLSVEVNVAEQQQNRVWARITLAAT